MVKRVLLRMKDLASVGITNWPTLKRRIQQDNFPPGRYVGKNTRVWTEEEVERWFNTRPSAAPPEILRRAPSVAPLGNPPEAEAPVDKSQDSEANGSPQPLCGKGGKR